MMRATLAGLLMWGVCCAGASAQDRDRNTAGSIHGGTMGLGMEIQQRLSDTLVVRGGVDRLRHDFERRYGGVDYEAGLDFDTVGVFLDLHPFSNALFVSGGGYMGARELRLTAEPDAPVEIGGAVFTPAQVGRLSGEATLTAVSPFVGVGFDTTFTSRRRVGLRALFGVAVGEDPEVALTSAGGTLSNHPAFRARLDIEARRIEQEAEYSLYPVAQIGLTYRF